MGPRQPVTLGAALVGQLVAPLLLVTLGLLFFSSTGRDDPHITFWAGHALARFGRILNCNGILLEQSSSLLQVVMIGALERLFGGDPVTIGKCLCLFSGALAVVLTYRLALRIEPHAAPLAAVFTATSPFFVYWSLGGLESTLVAAAGLALFMAAGRFLDAPRFTVSGLLATAVAMCAFAMVRPEAPLVLLVMASGTLLVFCLLRFSAKPATVQEVPAAVVETSLVLGFCFVAVAISVALLAYRYESFGQLLPQPASAKTDVTAALPLEAGLRYLFNQTLRSNWGMAATTILGFIGVTAMAFRYVAQRVLRPFTLLPLLFTITYVAFIVGSGGDWMEGGRFLVPVLPVVAITVPVALWSRVTSRVVKVGVSALFLVAALSALTDFAATKSTGSALWAHSDLPAGYSAEGLSWFERHNRVNVRDIPTISHLDRIVGELSGLNGDRVHIMTGQMGMVAYHVTNAWFGHVEWLDRYGISDSSFTDCALMGDSPHSNLGILVSYADYFSRRSELQEVCGIRSPDIVVDIHPTAAAVVKANGYTVVYEQHGIVQSSSTAFPGATVSAYQFIAVRNDLIAQLASATPMVVKFPEYGSK